MYSHNYEKKNYEDTNDLLRLRFFFFPHLDFGCILASVLACAEMSLMSTSALEKQKQL